MTPQEAAAHLHGRQYTKEVSADMERTLWDAGLVAVFGASDDLMELRGAINDEIGCWGGGSAYLTREGLLQNDCDDENCPHFGRIRAKATPVKALWEEEGYSWIYDTEIPHATFDIYEDNEAYCRGIVFRLSDVPA